MKRILVIHGLNNASRSTNFDHVFCISREFPGDFIQYHHCLAPVNSVLVEAQWDLCIFTYCSLTMRSWTNWERIIDEFLFLNKTCGRIVLVPQDDYTWSLALDKWAEKFKAEIIFTPLRNDLGLIYPKALAQNSKMSTVLTGYFNEQHLQAITSFAKPFAERKWDVGTRVNFLRAYLGRAAQKKGRIALEFRDRAVKAGLKQSISTSPNDVLLGMKWFEFLGDCRFTVGSLGGASMLDPDGSRRESVDDYLSMRPDAEFEEVESACFLGEDGYDFSAIGPRIIEAAATRTCQILAADEIYLPGMEPWVHYVPLEDDCENFDQIESFLADHRSAEVVTENCYELVIAKGDYLYGRYSQRLVEESLALPSRLQSQPQNLEIFLDKMKTHDQNIRRFEMLRESLGQVWYSNLLINSWRNARFHQLDALLDVAQRMSEVRDGSVLAVSVASYPPRPYSRFELESAIPYLRKLRDINLLPVFIDLLEEAIANKWQPTAFSSWEFCDYTAPLELK